jgi:hypothetical protein
MALPVYATVDDLKDRLNLDPSDARNTALQDVIEVASRWIDRECRRRFYTLTETRYYSVRRNRYSHLYPDSWHDPVHWESPWGSSGVVTLDIDDFVSVSSVTTDFDGDGVYETTWTQGVDFWLGPRNAQVQSPPEPYMTLNKMPLSVRWFPYYQNSIAVTGECGYCTQSNRPPEIRELCLIISGYLFGQQLSRYQVTDTNDLTIPGVQEYQIGQELRVVMDKATESSSSFAAEIPKNGLDLINQYRKTQPVVI